MVKALTATGCGKQKETPMATFKAVMRSALEYSSSIWLCCCCLPNPLTLVCGGGESDHPAFGPPASLSVHLASNSITPTGSVHKSRGDSVVRMWVKLKRWCVSCVCCRGGIVVMDVIWRRLCVSMI